MAEEETAADRHPVLVAAGIGGLFGSLILAGIFHNGWFVLIGAIFWIGSAFIAVALEFAARRRTE